MRGLRAGVGTERVAVIGAGVAGLVAAAELAARGVDVVVLERAGAPGGKMREVRIGDARIDAGPTVLTMRHVFDAIFADAGASFEAAVTPKPAEVLARHAWNEDERLDLFADVERSTDAIAAFAGGDEARGYARFCADARRVYETLEAPFLRSPRPSLTGLVRHTGLRRLPALFGIRPFATYWRALGDYFHDPRLRQLFGRYATYVGSSPFLAPATLMLIAHVEQTGVWLVEGGMHRIATALARLAEGHGARIRLGTPVAGILVAGGRACGVALESGEHLPADAVLCNTDVAALATGRLGDAVRRSVSPTPRARRSLSAVTWTRVARSEGFPLLRHNVFFGRDYAAEFEDVFRRGRLPRSPTVYVCAQDRDDRDRTPREGPERLLYLVNAPPAGDSRGFDAPEIASCERAALEQLRRCGLRLEGDPEASVATTPADFERLFPATGGALYGPASHGWRSSFRRTGVRSSLPGLYLAGGSTHPGPGVPMVALAGRMAAAAIRTDFASTRRSPRAATAGGTSTP